jgi:nicotinamidase-related amidase
MKYAVLVIDMLNEYLDPKGKVYCDACRNIIPALSVTLAEARLHQIPIIYVNTALSSKHDPLAKKWGLHAVKGTTMSQVIPELKPCDGDIIVEKKGYNGFFKTNLLNEVNKLGVTSVVITGIHTHVCVLLTAVSAFENGLEVITLSDCISTGYRPNHDTRLRFFETHVGKLISSGEWIASLCPK